MSLEELLEFIQIEDRRLQEKFNYNNDKEKLVLSRTVKMTEELGELCNEVLRFNKQQRQEKLDQKPDNLKEEFADVLITTLLLAHTMQVDIREALENKIDKINQRYI